MSVKVICPSCRAALTVPDRLVGEEVDCEECGDTFVARARRSLLDRADNGPRRSRKDDDSDVERPRRRKSKPPANNNATVGIIIGAVACVLSGTVVFLLVKKKDNPQPAPAPNPMVAFNPGPQPQPQAQPQPQPQPAETKKQNPTAKAPVQSGDLVTLSNPRWGGAIAARPGDFQVDYKFKDGQRPIGPPLTLKWKYSDGTMGSANLIGLLNAEGTLPIKVLGPGAIGGRPSGPIEIWVERGGVPGPFGKSGTKVSNTVTLN